MFDNNNVNNLIQIVHDGSILTTYNLYKGTMINLNYPIIVTDTPESIGMQINLPKIQNSNNKKRKKNNYNERENMNTKRQAKCGPYNKQNKYKSNDNNLYLRLHQSLAACL